MEPQRSKAKKSNKTELQRHFLDAIQVFRPANGAKNCGSCYN